MSAAPGRQLGSVQTAYDALRAELHRQLAPIAGNAGIAVGLVIDTANRTDWLIPASGCACSQGESQCVSGEENRCDRLVTVGDPLRKGGLGFRTVICSGKDQAPLSNALLSLVSTLVGKLNLHEQEGLLLQELVRSWETLDIISNLNLDLRTLNSRQEKVDRLLDCAGSCARGLNMILWVQDEDRLALLGTRNAQAGNSRDAEKGLVGAALKEGSVQMLNQPQPEDLDLRVEPELEGSGFAAAIPVRTPAGLRLALQVWNNAPEPPLDSSQLRFLLTVAVHVAMVVENDQLQEAAIEGNRIRHEAEVGAHIQQDLLLGQVPDDLTDIQIANVMVPARQVAGDFYDFFQPGRGYFDVVVGDVMGKGIPAALLGAATKGHILRGHAQSSDSEPGQNATPAEIVQGVNLAMAKRFIALNSFVTVFYVRFDTANGQATFVDAGHNPMLRLRHSDGKVELLRGGNLPLGVSTEEKYEEATVELEAGDIFVLYTDGVTQAHAADGEYYGEERLVRALEENREGTPEEIAARICSDVICFGASEVLDDDLTCLVVKVISAQSPGKRVEVHMETVGQAEELRSIRMWLRQFCEDHSSSFPGLDAVVDRVELAWQEALTNIMRHALKGVDDKRLELRASLEKDRIVLEAFHFGHPFDPATAKPPVFDGSQGHGFGVYLISQLTDEQVYSQEEGKRNRVRLVKYLAKSQEAITPGTT